MKKITVSILTTLLMLSMVFSSSVFAANEKVSAWDSFLGLFGVKATETSDVGVEYRGHVENKGDFPLDGTWIQGPDRLGTVGEGLRLEAFWIKLAEDAPEGLNIEYQVHVQNKGWMGFVNDGAMAGTEAEGLRIEAIEIALVDDEGDVAEGYSVEYRGHVQNIGDTAWYADGDQLGTTGSGLRLEALEIKIVQLEADLTAYEAALAAVKQADYTAASWTAYQAVVNANVVTVDNTQAEVDEATAAIIAAQADLVKVLKVESVSAMNVKQVKVVFNAAVDKTTAEKVTNYTVGSLTITDTGNDASVASLQADGKTVIITLDNDPSAGSGVQMQNQVKYNVTIKNVKGTNGQFVADTTIKDVQCIDTTLPVVSSIQVTGPKALKVVFNKPVATAAANFLLDNGAVGVDSTVVSVPSENALNITTSAALAVGQHTLVVNNSANNNFKDFAGLIVYKSTNTFEVVADTTAPTVSVKEATPVKITLQFSKPVKDVNSAANEVKVGYAVVATGSITPVASTSSVYNTETYATEWEVVPATAIAGSTVDVKIDNKATTKSDQILDKFDNSFVTTTVTANVVADTLKPAPTAIAVKSDKQLVVSFNKEVTATDAQNRVNYLLYDKNGALVKNETGITDSYGQLAASTVLTYDNTKKEVTIDLASSLKPENYSLKISNIKDTISYNQQTIAATTIGFNVADKTQLQLSSAAWVLADRTITLTFTKSVATTGDGSALNVANYKIDGAELASGSSATLGGSDKIVVIALGGSTNVAGKTIAAAIKDSAGSLIDVANASATLSAPTVTSADIQNVKLLDKNTVTFEVKKPLKNLNIATSTPSKVAGINIVSGSYSNQNITVGTSTVYGSVVTVKVADTTPLATNLNSSGYISNPAGTAGTNALDLEADALETVQGAKNTLFTVANGSLNEKDYAAPVIKAITTKDVNADGMIDKVVVEYTEPIQSGDVGTASYTVDGYTASNAYVSTDGTGTVAVSGKYAEIVINQLGRGDTDAKPATKQVVAVRDISPQANVKAAESAASVSTTDGAAPVIMSAALNAGKTSLALTFSEGVTTNADGTFGALVGGDLNASLTGGAALSTITHTASTSNVVDVAITGGATILSTDTVNAVATSVYDRQTAPATALAAGTATKTITGGLAAGLTLTADTTANTVDNAIEITFTDDSAWRAAITAVKVGGTALTVTTDYTVTAGKITLLPSGANALLTTAGSKAVTVEATGYGVSSVTQVIDAGAVASLTVTQSPVLGTRSGTTAVAMSTQPVITLKDQYNNTCTTGPSATATVVLTVNGATTPSGATVGTGAALTPAAIAGVATFSGVTVTPGSDAQITDLDLTFTTNGTITVDVLNLSTTA